jgi:hypothetical protein
MWINGQQWDLVLALDDLLRLLREPRQKEGNLRNHKIQESCSA